MGSNGDGHTKRMRLPSCWKNGTAHIGWASGATLGEKHPVSLPGFARFVSTSSVMTADTDIASVTSRSDVIKATRELDA
jgi:hypothetical protein